MDKEEELLSTQEYRKQIIAASKVAVTELIKVLREPIIDDSAEDISADRLKNAAAAKKLASFDAFEILSRIDTEEANLTVTTHGPSKGFAENKAR